MRIAVTAAGRELSDPVALHIGRASHILIMDTIMETGSAALEVKPNPIDPASAQGSGMQTCRNIIEIGADLLITGACGPRAYRKLEAAGIKVVPDTAGAAGIAIRKVINEELSPASGPGRIIETAPAE